MVVVAMTFVVMVFSVVIAIIYVAVVAMAVAVVVMANVPALNVTHIIVRFADRMIIVVCIVMVITPRIPDCVAMLFLPHSLVMLYLPVSYHFMMFYRVFVGKMVALTLHGFMALVPAAIVHHHSPDSVRMNIDC